MDNALEVKNLKKSYDGFELKEINITVPKGSIVGVIGENGAGKSTTFKSILNLIHKDSGDVFFYGERLEENEKALKEQIGVVFDEINFSETLTPSKIGRISALIYKNWVQQAYDEYLKRFKIPKDKEIKDFSKGMKVKLNLSVALSHQAKFLILDEATSGLDPVIRDEILDIFLDFIQDEEKAILISSHITSDLEKIADYIVFIHEGKVVLNGKKDELMYEYGIVRCGKEVFDNMPAFEKLAYRKNDYEWEILVKNRNKIQKEYPKVVVDHATLEEIILLYVKGERV